MKRVFDLVVGVLALMALSPVMLVLALLVRARLGSPVLFRQGRAGLAGKRFDLIKFRTMTNATDDAGRLLSDAERLVPFGQQLRATSLDELPTLINVVRGDMSLVGPRPLHLSYVARYSSEQRRRLEVKPGVTGWAQVNGRNALGWSDKFRLDVWYVDNRSFGLDLKILLKTLLSVVRRDGIAADGEATMTEFQPDTGSPPADACLASPPPSA